MVVVVVRDTVPGKSLGELVTAGVVVTVLPARRVGGTGPRGTLFGGLELPLEVSPPQDKKHFFFDPFT